MKKLLPALFAALFAISCPGERVLFFGDSITHGGKYIFYLQLFENLRHPGSGVRYLNGGRSGGTARTGLEIFDREIAASRPDRAIAMFGMNDIGRHLYAEAEPDAKTAAARKRSLDKYRGNLTELVGRFRDAGIPLSLMTPTPFDQYTVRDVPNLPYCNEPGGAAAAEIVREIAASNRLGLIELHAPLTAIWKAHAKDFVFANDRVHPGDEGHLLVAANILEALGVSPIVNEIEVRASDGRSAAFDYAPGALPFPMIPEYAKDLEFYPFTERFNREIVRVTGLVPGRYSMALDGKAVGEFSAEDFVAGVNIATLETPNQLRARELVPVMRELQRIAARYRNVVLVRRLIEDAKVDPADRAAADKWLDGYLDGLRTKPWFAGVKGWVDVYRADRDLEAESLAKIEALYARLAAVRPAVSKITIVKAD